MTENKIIAKRPSKGEPWDVVIIGSGPAGLTAAIYTTRGAASTLILGGTTWGGQLMLTTEVDNYPAVPGVMGPELMTRMKDHSLLFGAELIEKDVESVNFEKNSEGLMSLVADGKEYLAKSVLVATGSQTRWLGVPGEDKLRGRGVSSCAPCDAPFFKDKKVIVVGGGDSAMEEALVLAKYASQVVIVHRRDMFKASAVMQDRVLKMDNSKIDVIWDTEITNLMGEAKLESVELKTRGDSVHKQAIEDIQVADHNGNIVSKENDLIWNMPVDGVFVAIGHTPSTKIFEGKLELDEKGYIVKKPNEKFVMATSVDGVFVAGDVHDHHYMQAITAAGFGCQAAMDTIRYLDK